MQVTEKYGPEKLPKYGHFLRSKHGIIIIFLKRLIILSLHKSGLKTESYSTLYPILAISLKLLLVFIH